MTTKLV